MYLCKVKSIDSEDPVYQRLPGGKDHFFIPEARVAKEYVRYGLFEGPIIDWVLSNFVKETEACVDIGAHVGHYTVNLAHKASRVYAFECSPKSFNYLCANIALQNLDYKVDKFNVALSNETGTARFFIRDPLDGGSNGITQYRDDVALGRASVEVPTRTLDSFGLKNVGFLKIDVENHEKEVLEGAVQTLQENGYPPFLFESWRPDGNEQELSKEQVRKELFLFIESLGYRIQPLDNWMEGEYLATHPSRT
jgi:FkbM family methyltransferase